MKPGYADKAEPEADAYSSPSDAPISGCLSIKTALTYALDYRLPPTVCDRLLFDAQYSDATMIFSEVGLNSRDGTLVEYRWIKYYISGSVRAAVTDRYPNEYTLWWPAFLSRTDGYLSIYHCQRQSGIRGGIRDGPTSR